MGRSCIDLHAKEVGLPLVEIKDSAAHVGGSPTNISMGARRLGLRTALLAGFPVEVYNILGAGDACGAGFLYDCVGGRGVQIGAAGQHLSYQDDRS